MDRLLRATLTVYALATFAHHAHNAHFLDQYPGMPAWLSPAGVGGSIVLRTGHYLVAPVSAQSAGMNATIRMEVAAGSLLLIILAWTAFSSRSARPSRS